MCVCVCVQVWQPFIATGTNRLARYAAAMAASGSAAQPPMVVTFRLSGLDGEATETVVKTLTGAGDQQKQVWGNDTHIPTHT